MSYSTRRGLTATRIASCPLRPGAAGGVATRKRGPTGPPLLRSPGTLPSNRATAHTLTPDLITDTVVDHVGALVRELAHHRLLEMGMQSAHLPRMQSSHGRPLMTRSQDFDAMSAHYGYAPVCAVLSQRFGATFEFTTTA